MVSIVNDLMTKYVGLSTDAKPTQGMSNGSSYTEMDTGLVYYWDAEGESWVCGE